MDECTVRECFNRVSEQIAIQDEYTLLIRYVSQSRNLILGVPGRLIPACISLSDLVVENSKSCKIQRTLRREVKTYTFGHMELEQGRRDMIKIIEEAERGRTKLGSIKPRFRFWKMLMDVLISDWTWQH